MSAPSLARRIFFALGRAALTLLRLLARSFYLTYIFIFRVALYVLTLALAIYFGANSSWFNRLLFQIIDDAIPGAIAIEGFQWGPVPWQVRIVGVDITHPSRGSVIRADKVYAEVDLLDLFSWLGPEVATVVGIPGLDAARSGFHIRITAAVVEDYEVILDFLPGDPTPVLAYAFDDGLPSTGPPGLPVRVYILGAFGSRGRCTLRFPDVQMEYEGIAFSGGRVDIEPEGVLVYSGTTDVARGKLELDPSILSVGGEPFSFPIKDFHSANFVLLRDRIHIERAEMTASESRVTTQGQLVFPSGAPNLFDAEVTVEADSRDELVRRLLEPVWSTGGTLWVHGYGSFERPRFNWQVAVPRGSLYGFGLDALRADGGLGATAAAPDSPARWRLDVHHAEAHGLGGTILLDDASADLATGDVMAVATLADIDPAAFATSPAIGALRADVAAFEGAVSGRAVVAGSLRGSPRVRFAIEPEGLLYRPRALDPDGPLGAEVRVQGDLVLDTGFAVRLRGEPLVARAGDLGVMWQGELDVTHLDVDATIDVDLDAIASMWPAGGAQGWQGSVRLADFSLDGPLMAPRGSGAVAVRQGRASDLPVGDVTARVALEDGVVTLTGVRAEGQATLEFEAEVRLFAPTFDRLDPRIPFQVTELDAFGVPIAWLAPALDGRLDISAGSIRGELADPLHTLRGGGRVTARDVVGWPFPLARLDLELKAEPALIRVPSARAALGRNEVVVVRDLAYHPRTGELRARVATEGFPLDRLVSYVGGRGDFQGTIAADVALHLGGANGGEISGEVAAEKVSIGTLALGDAVVSVSPEGPGRARLSGPTFFLGTHLAETSTLSFGANGWPERLELGIEFEDSDPAAFIPQLQGDAWAFELTGRADASLDLRSDSPALSVSVLLPPSGARATWVDGLREVKMSNRGEARARWSLGSALELDRLVVAAGGLEVALCGEVDARGRANLWAAAAGAVDLPEFARGVVSSLDASLRTASSIEAGAVPSRCAGIGSEVGAEPLALRGELGAPVFVGAIDVSVPTARLRGLPGELVIEEGSRLELATARRGGRAEQVIRMSPERPVRGRFGDGTFKLTGEARLSHFLPTALALHADVINIDYAASKELRVRANAALDLRGEELELPGRRLGLSGEVSIVEGLLGSSSSLNSQLFGGSAGRKLTGAPRSLLDSVPWVGETTLDINARSSNVQVRFSLPVGQADLDLRLDARVGGTVADPELYGRLEVLSGGMIRNTVLGREFEVRRASIDFSGDPSTPTISAELRAEVTFQESRAPDTVVGSGQIFSAFSSLGAQEKTVGVTVTITGTANLDAPGRELQDINVDLASDSGGYERSELFTLLVTGVPPGTAGEDVGRGGGVVNLFADEIASLLAGTLLGIFIDTVNVGISLTGGLDWALRKSFGRNLQVSVSGFQDASGQRVEPRFELRITERLSLEGALRYQQLEQVSGQKYEAKLRYRIPLDK